MLVIRSVALALFVAVVPGVLASCGGHEERLAPRSQTWAELRTVRRDVKVTPPGEGERAPYPRERLVDGEAVSVGAEGLAWIRRDGGATLLVRGPAKLVVRPEAIEVAEGRVFVDTPSGATTELATPSGPLHLAHVRASIDVRGAGDTDAYVLAGEIRTDGGGPGGAVRAGAGERLKVTGKAGAAKAETAPALTWEDWTGGLATTDRAAEPAPYGVGTVGARRAGEQGSPRFPLAIQRLDVRVSVEDDFAVTEVDETFFNPSSEVMEGIYRFRTPDGATLHRFGVDRDGVVVWGKVKEKQAAAAQYQQNVYQGSTEDPALLEWDAPGVYRARLYPIGPGESRRVVVRYAEWLGRSGKNGERRLYVYPMAAEGAEESLPHIEELYARVDLGRAGAKEVRVGMAGTRDGEAIVVRAHDLVPRADLSVELFDDGLRSPRGYRAPHRVDVETLPPSERSEAQKVEREEADYVLFPVRAGDVPLAPGGLDLGIVVDTSAATDPAMLALARAATGSLLAHLGKDDRAVVWAGDDALRPVLADRAALAPVDAAGRRAILTALAAAPRGGATDLGNVLSQAAAALDPARRGAVVYIGDGAPTVGELGLADLRARLAKLPRAVRIFGLGVGDGADMAILKGLAGGAFAERIGDANGAARAALRLFEEAERPAWLGASIDLGPNIERVFPRDLGAIVADEGVLVIGRTSSGAVPSSITVTGPGGSVKHDVRVTAIDDRGDLRRRWAEGRLGQMMDEGTGRAAMVDLGSRHGIITPVTSLYVPTRNETSSEQMEELRRAQRSERVRRAVGGKLDGRDRANLERQAEAEEKVAALQQELAASKEGGTGTRAKGEEGSMGNRNDKSGRFFAPPASRPAEAAASPAEPRAPQAGPAPSPVTATAAATATAQTTPTPDLADAPKRKAEGKAASLDDLDKRANLPGGAAGDPLASLDGAAPPAQGLDVSAARARALSEAAEFGMIGLLGPSGGDNNGAWGNSIGDSFGAGGLGLSGVGEGGGGRGEGIGLGDVGTLGHGAGTGTGQGFGSGHGRLGGSHRGQPPQVRMGATSISGRLPPEVIQRIVRQNFGRFRLCYEKGLANNPNLQGRVAARFVIGKDGALANVQNGGSDLPDGSVLNCVLDGFRSLSFPAPEDGIVTVTFPIMFSPGDGGPEPGDTKAKTGEVPKVSVDIRIGDVGHFAIRCGAAAFVPFEERIGLWRERLGRVAGNAAGVASVYRAALRGCEAPTWRERSKLLSLSLDAMPTVGGRVALWRVMFGELSAADALYRGILARVRTPAEMRELHQALGLKAIDPGLLEKALKALETPAARVQKLRALAVEWPDDFALALRLLDELEDAGDDAGAREQGRKLRARPDADARVRTAVGELYLRLAARAAAPEVKAADEAEARRAFGEIVEFAPDDPVARRRLGDLYRAHGWFAEAARQYETLARLAPDDPSVALLLASAAEGVGKLEEAVKWAEKGGAAGAPDAEQSSARTARALAATYLAWGRLGAREAGKKDEAESLAARAVRVLSPDRSGKPAAKAAARATLTWSHPELHPTLWSNALGAAMPAPEGDVTLGVAQVQLPAREGAFLEVRVEPDEVDHAARLGAVAVLTVVFDETEDGERIVKLPVTFERGGPATQRFQVRGNEVTR